MTDQWIAPNRDKNTIELLEKLQFDLDAGRVSTNRDLHDLLVILIVGMDKFGMSNTKYRYLVDLILNKGYTVRDAIKRIQTDDANESWHHYYPKGH